MPQTGDYLINIDRGNLRELVHDLDAYEKVYSADENIKYGNLYRRNERQLQLLEIAQPI